MPDLDVRLAGAVSLRRGDRRVGEGAFGARQLRLVTAVLVLERDRPVTMDALATELWPDQPPTQWKVAVRGLVSQFRRRLVDLGYDADAVVGDQGRYVVDLADVRVDLEVASDDVAEARRAVDQGAVDRASLLAGSARSVLSRPVLSGVESDWVERLRGRVAQDHLESLVLLGECRRRLGAPADARRVLAEAIGVDPLREDAWRALMRAEAAAGNVARALVAYEDCRRRLADELGVDPAQETQHLHAELLRDVPDPDELVASVDPGEGPGTPARDVVPYVGLRAFTAAEADRFFGRDAEVQALVGRLARYGIVAVVGPSGVGKSSLVRAGLLPALAHGAIPDSDTWIPVVMTPTAAPRKALVAALVSARDDVDEHRVATAVGRDADGLHDAAGMVLDGPPASRLLVVVDQLEELFTLGAPDRAAAFVGLLMAATERLDRRVVVVVTLRADFYDRAAEVAGLADLLSHSQFVVPSLDGEQVEAAITGPARRAGISLEPGLLGRIVTDVAGEPGSLPLLQHLLYELWEHRVDRVLTRGAYDDLGGVTGALAHRAEQVHAGLERDERAVARRILLRAVQPGEDGGDARRPVPEDELHGPGDDDEQVDRVVARLVDARLLTAGHDAPGEGRRLELAHEALIDGWPRLRAWVDEVRGWLLDHRRLTLAAQEWVTHERHDDWLLAGLPLDEAHELVLADGRGDVDLHLSPAEHELVQASLEARDLVHAWEAEREQRRRDLERRSASRLRVLVAFVFGVALVAGALWWNATRQTQRAEAAELAAMASQVAAEEPQLAMLLGLEARSRLGSLGGAAQPSVDQAMRQAIAANRLVSWIRDAGPVLALDSSGDLFAEAELEPAADGTWPVRVRRTSTGEVVHRLEGHAGTGPVSIAAFSPDGSRVALGPLDADEVSIWDLDSGRLLSRLPSDTAVHDWFAFSPDGRMLVGTLGNYEGSPVAVWDVVAGERLTTLEPTSEEIPTDGSPHAVFHPDGRRLAFMDARAGTIRIVDTDTWEDVGAPLEYPEPTELSFSPDGAWLAVVSAEQLHILDAADFDAVLTIDTSLLEVPWSPLAWSADSTRLAYGSNPVRVWTVVEDGSVVEPGPPLELHARSMDCSGFAFTPGTDELWEFSICGDGLRSWDLAPSAGAEVALLPGTPTWQMGIDWAPDGSWLAAPVDEVDLVLWSTDTWDRRTVVPSAHVVGDWTPDVARIANLDVASDGETIVTAGLDDVAIWDTTTWEATRVGRGGWSSATVSPDGSLVAHAAFTVDLPEGDDRRVWVVDRDGQQLAELAWGRNLLVEDLAFSPDGRLLAVAAYDRADVETAEAGVYVWDWRAGQLVGFIDTGDSTAATVDWHSSGTRLLVATQRPGTRAEVWDVSEAVLGAPSAEALPGDRLVQTMEGHTDWVQEAVWSPDETTVATCSGDGTARLWDAASGHELQRLIADGLTGYCRLRFSPDGTMLALSDSGNGVRILTLESDRLAAIAQERLVRGWTLQECREYLDVEQCPT